MKYQIIGKNIEVTDSIRHAVEKKLSRMDKYFLDPSSIKCHVLVRSYKVGAKVEVTVFAKEMTFRAEVKDNDLYAAIDLSIDKLAGQMRKLKTRMDRTKEADSLGKALAFANIVEEYEEESQEEVVRTKSLYLEPMSLDEAITRMEALGHNFFLYNDIDDKRLAVVYVRADGGYGVIEAENKLK